MIYKKFLGSDLSEEEQIQLKEIDRAMLWYDLKRLLKEPQSGEAPQLHMELNYKVRSFSEVEKNTLRYLQGIQNCRVIAGYTTLVTIFSFEKQAEIVSLQNITSIRDFGDYCSVDP